MEPAEAACDLPAQDTGQPGVAVQVDTAPMSGLVCMDMGGHLSFNLKDVTGKVDKYLTLSLIHIYKKIPGIVIARHLPE